MNTARKAVLSEYMSSYKYQFILLVMLTAGVYSSIIWEMVKQWYDDPNYSHGFIVPLMSGYFAYERRADLKKTEVSPSNSGLFIVIFGLLMLIVGYVGTEYFTMRSSLIVLLAGMVLYFFGIEAGKYLLLPIVFLFFMVPLPAIVYNSFAFPLKLLVAKYSVLFLQAIGVVVVREGNILMFPAIVLEVADACSGMRSLMSLLALGVGIAFLTQRAAWKKWVVSLSAIPIAIVTNAVWVIVTGILAQHWGEKAAEGFFHEFAGLAIFGFAMILLAGVAVVMRRLPR
jgi:exosortase